MATSFGPQHHCSRLVKKLTLNFPLQVQMFLPIAHSIICKQQHKQMQSTNNRQHTHTCNRPNTMSESLIICLANTTSGSIQRKSVSILFRGNGNWKDFEFSQNGHAISAHSYWLRDWITWSKWFKTLDKQIGCLSNGTIQPLRFQEFFH